MFQGLSDDGLRLAMFCLFASFKANGSQSVDANWAPDKEIVGPRTTQLMSTNLPNQRDTAFCID